MARPLVKRPVRIATKPARQRTAADDRHDLAFALYRDMGPARSLRKLVEVLKVQWPVNSVSYTTIHTWNARYGWGQRVAEYDRGRGQANTANPAQPDQLSSSVDEVDVLRGAASQALAIIARASSMTITRPGDVKVLLEAARMAQERADKIEASRTGEMTQEQVTAEGVKILAALDVARRKDLAYMVLIAAEAACKDYSTRAASRSVLRTVAVCFSSSDISTIIATKP
jgi:hypothetical protein